jgi:hypothetical protein
MRIEKETTADGLERALIAERAVRLELFAIPLTKLNEIVSVVDSANVPEINRLGVALYEISGLKDLDQLAYLSFVQEYLDALRAAPHKRMSRVADLDRRSFHIPDAYYITRVIVPSVSARSVQEELVAVAVARAAVSALAVLRFQGMTGMLPDSLESVTGEYMDSVPQDPFTGKAMRYICRPDEFAVYSVGPDGKDDGGEDRRRAFRRRRNSFDIPFAVERQRR